MEILDVRGLFHNTTPTSAYKYTNTTGNVHKNLILSRVRVTTVAVEKYEVLHILSVCL